VRHLRIFITSTLHVALMWYYFLRVISKVALKEFLEIPNLSKTAYLAT